MPCRRVDPLVQWQAGVTLGRVGYFNHATECSARTAQAEEVGTRPFDGDSATGSGFCNRPETEFFQGTALDDLCPLTPY